MGYGQRVVMGYCQPGRVVMGYGQPGRVVMGYGRVVMDYGQPVRVVMVYGQPGRVVLGYGQPVWVVMGYCQPGRVVMGYGQPGRAVMGYGQPGRVEMGYGQPGRVVMGYGQPVRVVMGYGQLNSNLASICTVCVNYRVNSYGSNLTALKSCRDSLYSKLSEVLVSKMASDLKVRYELLESAMYVLEKNRKEQLEKYYPNLICTQSLSHMAITSERLHKQSVVIKQICKLFPQRKVNIDGQRKDGLSGQYDQNCNARLPKGLDPHSVPSDELAASLGYMVQLLNLIVNNVGAPALHNSPVFWKAW
ncbi:hypothetical protein L2E82_10149 [Cichorium intybus]|uniref:Uncharacterized protein n=1 Tax=Cichorium intybus TaxID=13427 RepID=A0ACB9GAD9_CICIN|nr:hypothetical protein L2E82_10149 [Cichorium intybus]